MDKWPNGRVYLTIFNVLILNYVASKYSDFCIGKLV